MAKWYHPTQGTDTRIINGNETAFLIHTSIPHGKTERTIACYLPADAVLKLTEIFVHTKHAGHAAWHLNNPKSPMPCSMCDGEGS